MKPLPQNVGQSDTDIVYVLLAVQGLSPSNDEIAVLASGYRAHRAAVDRLYQVPVPPSEFP